MNPPRVILAVFAHPDDEAYSAGGLLALCARAGARVVVACATDCGAQRARELATACRALGAAPPVRLGLEDGRVAQSGAEPFAALLRAHRPALVVTHGSDGGYGHTDHIACARRVGAAIEALPPARRPRLLHAEFPRGLFARVCRALRRARAAPIDASIDADQLGIEPARADLALDIGAARDAKLAAIAAHRSQLRDGDPLSLLRGGIVDRLLDVELFSHAAGPPLRPGATDPLAGL